MTNNTADLKKFAQRARRELREQVAGRLEQVLRTDSAELREREAALRELREEIAQTSKKALVDKVAYTWFNRFCALRFMDVNHYTRMGVVSPAEGLTQPEILQEAKGGYIDEALTNFVDPQQVYGLLNGQRPSADPQQEAYRLLLVAVCNSYNASMPFLFEKIADYTELLMPLDLLSEHSILHDLREALTPEACQDVEVIGWLYQYYISERKDEVFEALKQNQKIEAADIPAATQLFTPHWIVRYLVENSLGRLWMLNHPESRLAERMEYYIKDEVRSQKDEGETKSEVRSMNDEENRSSFILQPSFFILLSSPEEIKLADPACGSGHILTYAFDLLYAIYEESGYTAADIPRLILQHNLYGIEIDARAGALAAFALTMKARARDRRFLTRDVQPNICVLKNVTFTPQELDEYSRAIGRDLFSAPLLETLKQFEQAENFGALIRPSLADAAFTRGLLESRGVGGDLFLYEIHQRVLKVLQYAEFLAPRYHVVVANPPYMGGSGMNDELKEFAGNNFPDSKSDLGITFIERNLSLVVNAGVVSMITMQSWMFLSSYEKLRRKILKEKNIVTMAHLGARAFDSIGGEIVSTTAFVLSNENKQDIIGSYLRLIDGKSESEKAKLLHDAIYEPQKSNKKNYFESPNEKFLHLPGSQIAYWIKGDELFLNSVIENHFISGGRNKTHDNEKYLRFLWEVSSSNDYWELYANGGEYRKYFGNEIFVVNWSDAAKFFYNSHGGLINKNFWNKEGVTWSLVSSKPGFRIKRKSNFYSSGSPTIFTQDFICDKKALAFLNSPIAHYYLQAINPTINTTVGDVFALPYLPNKVNDIVITNTDACLVISEIDWNSYETSKEFKVHPFLALEDYKHFPFSNLYYSIRDNWHAVTTQMQNLEQENNRIFIEAYGLQDELTPEVPLNEITLTCNPRYRYGGNRSDEELESLLRADTMKEFISYAVGCMFGRYSLEKPGLVLANQGETVEDYWRKIADGGPWTVDREASTAAGDSTVHRPPSTVSAFAPDDDNVIPVLEGEWFSDDITERFKKFLRVTFGDEHYAENLAFIEEALGRDVRSYFMKEFYKEHIQMYKKRPIYWMFSSAKGSFNVLIYMHRYQPDTISVILNRYLREFRAKLEARKAYLEQVSISGVSTAREKVAAEKETQKWSATLEEIRVYERDVLYPLATQKLTIDLDDGVKLNYAKFGSALAKIAGL